MLLLVMYPKNSTPCIIDANLAVFIAAIVTVARRSKQSKHLTNKWIMKIWYTYTILINYKTQNEILNFAGK